MAKGFTYATKKKKKNNVGGIEVVGTISQKQKGSGYNTHQCGTGAHGGTKKQQVRKDRRRSDLEIKHFKSGNRRSEGAW